MKRATQHARIISVHFARWSFSSSNSSICAASWAFSAGLLAPAPPPPPPPDEGGPAARVKVVSAASTKLPRNEMVMLVVSMYERGLENMTGFVYCHGW